MKNLEIKVENADGDLNKNFTITGHHFVPNLSDGGPMKNFSLVFDKFFPYDNGNGQPIYNTDNGAQLRDPITGL